MVGIIGIKAIIENPHLFLMNTGILLPVATFVAMFYTYGLGKLNKMLIEGICEKLQSK